MDRSYITPLISSVQRVFETMLQLPVTVGEPALQAPERTPYDVSGIIGLSGDVEGVIILSFPIAVAERVVSLFTGTDLNHTHEDFPDAVGELVNMISGNAKAQFPHKKISLSCPSVVIGRSHQVFGSKDVVCVVLPCQCDVGDFAVELAVRQSLANLAAPIGPATAGQMNSPSA